MSLADSPGDRAEGAQLERRLHFLLRRVKSAQRRFHLLADGDRVLVGLSGGKDSAVLLHLLARWRESASFSFELAALHVRNPARTAPAPAGLLQAIAAPLGVDLLQEEAGPDPGPPEGDRPAHPCFHCSRERRRLLLTHAIRHGFNKVALGHHLDDAAQTVLMNVLFKGNTGGMRPSRDYGGGRVRVIRPLILAEEKEIVRVSDLLGLEFEPCRCGLEGETERDRAARFLLSLGKNARRAKRHLLRLSLQAAAGSDSSRVQAAPQVPGSH